MKNELEKEILTDIITDIHNDCESSIECIIDSQREEIDLFPENYPYTLVEFNSIVDKYFSHECSKKHNQRDVINDLIWILEQFKSVDIFDSEALENNNMSLDNFKDEISDGRLNGTNEYSLEQFEIVLNRILTYSHK